MAKKETKKKAAKSAEKKPAKKKAKTEKPAAKKKEAKAKKTKAPRKSRSSKKKDVRVRQRLAWAVFNHAMKPVAKYAFNQKKAAEKKAKELSPEGKPPHFVARIKEEIVEEG